MSDPPSPQANMAQALEKLEQPKVRWRTIALITFAFVVIWGLAVGLTPWIGPWGMGVAGAGTLAALGFGLYVWRFARKQRGIVDILKTATDEKGRRAALEQLQASGKGGDAMNAVARAQLLAAESPAEAIRVLEEVDIKKAPAVVRDAVRANLALLYLRNNRTRDARPLVDEIRLDQQPDPRSKGMMAAVVAETFARTGKVDDARALVETYSASDPDYQDVSALLYRAQVYTFMASKKRGLAETAMRQLAAIDPNLVAAFAVKGANPQLAKMARQIIQTSGVLPKQRARMVRK